MTLELEENSVIKTNPNFVTNRLITAQTLLDTARLAPQLLFGPFFGRS